MFFAGRGVQCYNEGKLKAVVSEKLRKHFPKSYIVDEDFLISFASGAAITVIKNKAITVNKKNERGYANVYFVAKDFANFCSNEEMNIFKERMGSNFVQYFTPQEKLAIQARHNFIGKDFVRPCNEDEMKWLEKQSGSTVWDPQARICVDKTEFMNKTGLGLEGVRECQQEIQEVTEILLN